jgi:hypothetical protein
MSALKNEFQTVRLPDIALADMYRQHLVIVEPAAARQQTAMAVSQVLEPEPVTESVMPVAEPQPQPQSQPPQPQPQPSTPYSVLGHFSRRVLVVLQDAEAVHCNDTALAFLTKVIGAVGLSMEHIAILNTNDKQVTYPELKSQWPAEVALYFGVEPASIGVPMRFPHFQVQPWDGCTFLFAPSLSELNGSTPVQVEQKKQLWMALKKIFG